MKKTLAFLVVSVVLNASAFAAVGPTSKLDCKEVKQKVEKAKAAAAQAAGQQPASGNAPAGNTSAQ